MRTYVLGAGASYPIYPLGSSLLECTDRFIRSCGKWFDRFDYEKEWPVTLQWLAEKVFQKSRHDATRVEFPPSPVKVLHLHGAIGWYKKPHFREDFAPTDEGGAVPREALTPAPLDTEISLDPLFLRGLGISEVDASMPTRPSHEYQTLLHPSFLKDYTGSDNGTEIYRRLWKMASEALRAAERVAIVGYSLPPADTAAWALFVSSCNGRSTDIVDPSRSVMARYRRMLRLPILRPPVSFQEWVKTF